MTKRRYQLFAVIAGMVILGGSTASARSDDRATRTDLSGYEEVPAVSTAAKGSFRADFSVRDREFDYRLQYRGLSTPVQQAHIHFGQLSVNGGVSVFLCSNLGNGPAGTPACPNSGVVRGTITAAEVVGPSGQGIDAGEFDELVAAIKAGVAYVNVHTDKFEDGEIRGQLDRDSRHHHHH